MGAATPADPPPSGHGAPESTTQSLILSLHPPSVQLHTYDRMNRKLTLAVLFLGLVAAASAGEGDDDDYKNYVFQDKYNRVTAGGAIALVVNIGLCVAVVLARDIMRVVDCGVGSPASDIPARQLTTMSAAYAPQTMPH